MKFLFGAAPLALAATLTALGAGSAAAQVAGTYSGTSADGNGVSFTVATDPNTSSLAVTGALVFFSALCNDGSTLGTGWSYGLTQDISGGRVDNTTSGSYFSIAFKLKFSGDGQSATGSVASVSPNLLYVNGKPTKALLCKSPMQSLSVTLQPPGAKPPPNSGAMMMGKLQSGAR